MMDFGNKYNRIELRILDIHYKRFGVVYPYENFPRKPINIINHVLASTSHLSHFRRRKKRNCAS